MDGWMDGWSSVLCPHQHSIGYVGDGFYRSKDPTNSIKVLKYLGVIFVVRLHWIIMKWLDFCHLLPVWMERQMCTGTNVYRSSKIGPSWCCSRAAKFNTVTCQGQKKAF